MFLDLLQRRNPELLKAARDLHTAGQLQPNTYAIDLDALERNSRALSGEAATHGLRAFAMTKQIGRNPDASAAILAGGITHSVGVDLECAIAAACGGLRAGHVGHLVQIPRHRAREAAQLEPLYWTVFSLDKAEEVGAASRARGRVQDLLLRVVAPGDRFYPGHEGGIAVADLLPIAQAIAEIDGVRVAGVTSFPATLFDPARGETVSTPNLATLTQAKQSLEAAGFGPMELNAPGSTSSAILQTLANAGATQIEPGHGLTGTTPLHAVQDLVEDPAIVYVSEVSHVWDEQAYVFGGGLYVDPVLGDATTSALLIGRDGDIDAAANLRVDMPAAEAIDYYARIPLDGGHASSGDTVLFGFRPQVFVTRALTAGIRGISTGSPEVAGVWYADGSAPLTVRDALEGTTNR